jgi:hypothetical protein
MKKGRHKAQMKLLRQRAGSQSYATIENRHHHLFHVYLTLELSAQIESVYPMVVAYSST